MGRERTLSELVTSHLRMSHVALFLTLCCESFINVLLCVCGGGVLRSYQGEESRRQTPHTAGFHSFEIPSVCLLAIVTHLYRAAL